MQHPWRGHLNITGSAGTLLGDVAAWAGIPPSAVTSAQPGYQFYACIWKPATNHVGNRMAIGARIVPTDATTAVVAGLKDLTIEDPEFYYLIGCTVDGGEVPYALMDANGNWLSVKSGSAGSITINGSYTLDFESELPSRNGVPVPMDRFITIGDWVIGSTGIDTLVRISGSAASALNPVVLGRPEQSWAPDDVLMFPFRETVLNIQENGNDAIAFSNAHMARLVYAQGIWDWADTASTGIAGRRAFTQTNRGIYWLNYKKRLCTVNSDGPIEVSQEYERSLLSQIGPQYMDDVTLVQMLHVPKQIDQIIIKCRDSNGNPFEVIHDFNLEGQQFLSMDNTASGQRSYESGFQSTGQGYMRQYVGALATDYVMADCEDVNGFNLPFLGGPDGNIYLSQHGWNDGGVEFSADYIGMRNLGPQRPSLYDVELWGDPVIMSQEVFSWRKDLDGSSDWQVAAGEQNPGEEADFHYHNRLKTGDLHIFYFRFQMNSHSADAPTVELNDPPHLPLETYGKIYMARAEYSDVSRGQ